MGSVTSKAANSVGTLLGNAFAAPFKAIFGGSCKDVCSGAWDVACFVEHFCISNLLKLLMILGLCYIILVFFYLLFQLGICQCIVRSLCNMACALCKTYWSALQDITCFCWYKLKNVIRVNRRRNRHFQDLEFGYSSGEVNKFLNDDQSSRIRRKRKLLGEGRHKGRHNYTYPYARPRRAFHVRPANTRNHRRRHCHRQLRKEQVAYHNNRRSHSIKRPRQIEAGHEGHHRHAASCKRRRMI